MMLVTTSGCGALSTLFADAGDKFVEKQGVKLDNKLKAKYDVEKDDDIKTIVKKMFKVESKDDPTLANKLLSIAPQYWDEFTDENASWGKKLGAATNLAADFKDAYDESKDSHGNTKWGAGGTVGTLALLALKIFFMYRKKKKNEKDLIDAVQEGDNKKTKVSVANKNNTDLDSVVRKLYPRKDKEGIEEAA